MAARTAPAEAAAATASIPKTDNLTVNEDIFRVGAAVGPQHVGPLIQQIADWLKAADLRWHSQLIGKFVNNVTGSGRIDGALTIAANLLAFRASPRAEDEPAPEANALAWRPEPETRFDSYEYGELLKTILPSLVKANWQKTLGMLGKVLNGYILLRDRHDPRPGYDSSVFWRPSIDGNAESSPYDAIGGLVSTIRRVGDDQIAGNAAALVDVLGVTKEFKWDVFRRLELHWTLRALPNVDNSLLTSFLVNQVFVRSDRFDLEYGKLLRAGFQRLSMQDQRAIIDWFLAGPDLSDLPQGDATPEFKEKLDEWSNRWKVKKLYWIKDQLPEAEKALYSRWVEEGGEPNHPGYHVWDDGFEVKPEAPISSEAFRALSIEAQANYLRTWQPPNKSWHGPTKSAMAGLLQTELARDPSPYIANAQLFSGLAPVYLTAFFTALWQGIKKERVSEMRETWSLAKWMLQQPDDEIEVFDDWVGQTRKARPWQSARLTLARLLDSLLQTEEAKLPADDREMVWQLIDALAVDPDPSIHATAEDGDEDTGMGPFTLSLNSVRGEAVHAAFSYVGWCRRASKEGQWAGLPAEVKALFERLLNPTIDGTKTIRSIFGANVNRLSYWDWDWLKGNLRQIFSDGNEPGLGEIAWTTFITHASPYRDVFELLQEDFRRAVEAMAPPRTEKSRHDPRTYLGRYLVTMYWWGCLEFTDHSGLLAGFFTRAPEKVRAEVIEFIGRTLKTTKETIPPELLARLQKLWDWRFSIARTAGPDHFANEIGSFAWWFDSEKFDEAWSAQQMLAALEFSRRHENQILWMSRYAALAARHTETAIRALDLTVESARAAEANFWPDDEAVVVLKAGLRSPQPAVVDTAKRIQARFLRENRMQYLNL
jgi:hypothetical protein